MLTIRACYVVCQTNLQSRFPKKCDILFDWGILGAESELPTREVPRMRTPVSMVKSGKGYW